MWTILAACRPWLAKKIPLYYDLISAFHRKTGIPVILNTSFNENEPIVCTPEEAIDCFQRTRMDVLAIGPFMVVKAEGEKLRSSSVPDARNSKRPSPNTRRLSAPEMPCRDHESHDAQHRFPDTRRSFVRKVA